MDGLIQLLNEIKNKSNAYRDLHYIEATRFTKISRFLTITKGTFLGGTLLGAITEVSADWGFSTAPFIIGFGAIQAVLEALQIGYNPNEKILQHKKFAHSYLALCNSINQYISMPAEFKDKIHTFTKAVSVQYDELFETSPLISMGTIERYKKENNEFRDFITHTGKQKSTNHKFETIVRKQIIPAVRENAEVVATHKPISVPELLDDEIKIDMSQIENLSQISHQTEELPQDGSNSPTLEPPEPDDNNIINDNTFVQKREDKDIDENLQRNKLKLMIGILNTL